MKNSLYHPYFSHFTLDRRKLPNTAQQTDVWGLQWKTRKVKVLKLGFQIDPSSLKWRLVGDGSLEAGTQAGGQLRESL